MSEEAENEPNRWTPVFSNPITALLIFTGDGAHIERLAEPI